MPKARLTAKNVWTLPAIDGKRTDYVDTTLPGFLLRVSPTGARSYALAVWHQRRKRRVSLGKTGRVALAKARDEARAILLRLERGEEPEPSRDLGGLSLTVSEIVEQCIAHLKLRPSTRKEWGRLLNVEIRPVIGARPAEDLGRAEVRDWTRSIKARSGYTANRAFELLARAYSWARREELVNKASPCDNMPKPFAAQASERVLSAEELWALLRALDRGQRRWTALVDATRLLLLTGVRRAAVLGMRREELEDLEGRDPRWIVPGGMSGRSKSGRAHVVPLSSAALAVIRRRAKTTEGLAHLFPGRPRGGQLDDCGMQWPQSWRRWLRARLQRALNARRRRSGLAPETVPRWTIHGLRHTIATHLREDLDVTPDIVSLLLGHTLRGPQSSRIYDRAERLAERRRALDAWARWLAGLGPNGEGASRILPFDRSR